MSNSEVRWVREPKAPPKMLWRYVGLSTLLLLIEKGRVYIPTIEELKRNDPTKSSIICEHTRKFFETLDSADCDWLLQSADSYENEVLSRNESEETIRVRLQIWAREMAKRRCAWCWYGGSALHGNEAETVRDIIVEKIGAGRAHLVSISTASDVELSAADELKRADAYKSEIACFGNPKFLPRLLKRDLDIPGD